MSNAPPAENTTQTPHRLEAYKWQKGTSGNPGGRPRALAEFREECREHTGTALQTLLGVMNNPKAMSSSKVQAARVLLAYGWGAPSGVDGESADNRLIINILQLATQGKMDSETAVNIK